jgi:hypothetical protein
VKYGIISALIGIVLFLIPALMASNPFDSPWNWIGMGVGIVLFVLAHKNYKDSGDGYMSYGQGIGICFWMTLVSTVISFGFTYLYVTFIDHAPMDLFYQAQVEKMESQGQSAEAIAIATEWTKKLFWVIGLFMAIFFSMLIALIVTIFTQKKAPETNF